MNRQKTISIVVSIYVFTFFQIGNSAEPEVGAPHHFLNISGVLPHLALVADPTPRTESGTGGQ